jgi:3D (Asp-Asp-Asp) domain-containing protein
MLRVDRLMCLLSFIFIFNTYNLGTITPFHALATEVVKDNNMEMAHNNNTKTVEMPFNSETEIIRQRELEKESQLRKINEFEKEKQLQKEKQIQKEQEKEKKKEPEYKEFILTFYTSLESENSSAGAVTCQNKPLTPGGVANNVIPQNTNIYLEGYGNVTVNDRGSDKYFGADNRLDVYIPREPGESDRQYSRRVNNYGIQKVQGYIIK